MPHLIEIFTSDCPICRETISIVRSLMCPKCRLVEYDLMTSDEALRKAEEYGVMATPTLIIDGKIKIVGKPDPKELAKILQH